MILVGLFLVVSTNSYAQRLQGNQEQYQVLLFTKSLDYQHLSVPSGVQMFKELSQDNHFGLTWTEQSDFFDDQAQLNSMDVIVFMNTSGDILNDDQRRALQDQSDYPGLNLWTISTSQFRVECRCSKS